MARSRPKSHAFNEVAGIVLIGVGTLLLLALLSYDPADIPDHPALRWLAHRSPPNDPPHNFIGPIGAVTAGLLYFLLGGGAYLVAVMLLGFGGAKLVSDRVLLVRRIGWMIAFVLSGACLLDLQPWFLQDWRQHFNIQGAGGWLGHWLGYTVLRGFLGGVGATILLLALYSVSLILMTGIQPITLITRLREAIRKWMERREKLREERASERERLEIEQKRLEREQKRLERQLRKQGKPLPVTPGADPEEPAAEPPPPFDEPLPEPKIIDTSAAPPPKPPLPPRKTKEAKSKPEDGLAPLAETHFENYELPSVALLDEIDHTNRQAADPEELRKVQTLLVETLGQFGIQVSPGDITRGPTITRYEVYPARGVRVDKILTVERDLARATRAERINILAPIPGKDTVGIEIANPKKVKVTLRELIDSEDWQRATAKIPIALGKDVYGRTILADLAAMPHCLVAGTTGSGKSVCINAMIASMLYRFTPEELRFIMIDPKVVELQIYNKLPHLVIPVVNDPKKVLLALRWVIDEMEKRYRMFAKTGVRNITSFNGRPKPQPAPRPEPSDDPEEESGEGDGSPAEPIPGVGQTAGPMRVPREDDIILPERLPYIVVIVDELADLMQTAPADVESGIARITQMARAAGIHMIVATQTPRADVVTGVIKANIPSRIAFQVASKIDSRVILDENGAERLLGQGDMLYLPPGTSRMTRAQGVLVTDEEIHRLVEYAAGQTPPAYDLAMHERMESGSAGTEEEVSDEDEELVEKCLEIIRQEKRASTSLLQRRLRLGYTRAARVVDILEQRGILGPGEGARPREILVDLDAPSID